MSGPDPFDNLKGLAALSEIGRRLGDLGDKVRSTLKEGGSHETHASTAYPPGGVMQSSFRIRTLTGSASGGRSRQTGGGIGARAERTRARGPDLDDAREPLVDCFDEADAVVVTAELPGINPGEITLSLNDGALSIETTGARRYRARQALPADVDGATLSHEFRNGILEVRIAKASAPLSGVKP